MSLTALRERLRETTAGSLLLWVLSLLYGLAVLARGLLYGLGILRGRSIGAKVVCIGNLTTGGTGKTPAVVLAAQTLRGAGHAVAILSRGYGGKLKGKDVCVLDDAGSQPWTQCGDEPWMMSQMLKGRGVPILVSPDRRQAGKRAVDSFRSEVVILDDGFQHRRLLRDLDVVLVNAVDPFGGRKLLPLGDLREPASALRRAHIIMLTHVDQASEPELAALRGEVRAINPRAPVLESVHKADFVLDVLIEEKRDISCLQERKVAALSGIGSPASFEELLSRNGVLIAQRWRYSDHHRYTLRDLASLDHLRGGLPVVTTLKDFTRFPPDWRTVISADLCVLAIKLEIVKGEDVWNDALLGLAGGAAVSAGG